VNFFVSDEAPTFPSDCSFSLREGKRSNKDLVDDLGRLDRKEEARKSSNVDSSLQERNSGEIGLSSRMV
jgi:hypothetical protein